MRLQFEQLERESDKAFAPFGLYLSVGPERSLAKTAAKLVQSLVLMEKWSSKFDWPALARMRLRRTTMDSLACRQFWREKFSFISILDMPKFLGGISWQGPAIVTLGKWTRSFLGYCGTHSFTEPDAKHELGAHDPTTSGTDPGSHSVLLRLDFIAQRHLPTKIQLPLPQGCPTHLLGALPASARVSTTGR